MKKSKFSKAFSLIAAAVLLLAPAATVFATYEEPSVVLNDNLGVQEGMAAFETTSMPIGGSSSFQQPDLQPALINTGTGGSKVACHPVSIIVPKVVKRLNGATVSTDIFTFEIVGLGGAPLPTYQRINLPGNSEGSFGKITFTQAGLYTYNVYELSGNNPNISYDSTSYTFSVAVNMNAKKCLCVTGQKLLPQNNCFLFVNTCGKQVNVNKKVSITIKGEKRVISSSSDSAPKRRFNFSIDCDNPEFDLSDNLIWSYGGEIDFGTLVFYKPGEYKFTISEIPDRDAVWWHYDKTVYEVYIKVYESGGGNLSASMDIRDGSKHVDKIVFTNRYSTNPETSDPQNWLFTLAVAVMSLACMAVIYQSMSKKQSHRV